MTKCDQLIYNCDQAICMNLEKAQDLGRGMMSVNILGQLRNLVDHLCVKIYLDEGGRPMEKYYGNIVQSKKYVHSRGNYHFIKEFYDLLQISVSHYTLDSGSSERLMLKYYVYLLKLRKLAADNLGLSILHNLEKFPLDTDNLMARYHKEIATRIETLDLSNAQTDLRRFYIYRVKPFVADGAVYYEVTLSLANERASKFDRIIAFTKQEISPYYACFLRITSTEIVMSGLRMPVLVILEWEPSIRLCEIRNLGKIVGCPYPEHRTKEYENLMSFLKTGYCPLTEVMDFDDGRFTAFLAMMQRGGSARQLSTLLTACRKIIKRQMPGHNVLRYLLLRMNNKIIRDQYNSEPCDLLSDLRLTIKSKPFDQLPFSFSLCNHNPMLEDLLEAIPVEGHEEELLARRLKINSEHNGMLYTPLNELEPLAEGEDIKNLAQDYNDRLYYKHKDSASVEVEDKFAFISGYETNVRKILSGLGEMTGKGVDGYEATADDWLKNTDMDVDCQEKRDALLHVFSDSRVAFVYGAAGTGKSTFINYISDIFLDDSKIFLANTNPAVENLRRKVNTENASFMTIASYFGRRNCCCDMLVIDECSTVCNEDMLAILERGGFRRLLLVGDMFQIEAIRFGNWFGISHSYFKGPHVVELKKTFRTSDEDLLTTWEKVRVLSPDILEYLARNGYSAKLDESIFSRNEDDEIILCLNYGGLYGINNINRLLQCNNPNPPVQWGINTYKKGDPILFNETDRFMPFLHNNLKGEIVDIQVEENVIYFTLRVDTCLSGPGLENSGIEVISHTPDGTGTIIRISVDQEDDGDKDVETSTGIVPFQIAYAVSIHKAQGLEYKSVKVVITHDVEDLITHNIFYTAITRSCGKLKIYWTPETEKKVLGNLKFQFNGRDYTILKSRHPELR